MGHLPARKSVSFLHVKVSVAKILLSVPQVNYVAITLWYYTAIWELIGSCLRS